MKPQSYCQYLVERQYKDMRDPVGPEADAAYELACSLGEELGCEALARSRLEILRRSEGADSFCSAVRAGTTRGSRADILACELDRAERCCMGAGDEDCAEADRAACGSLVQWYERLQDDTRARQLALRFCLAGYDRSRCEHAFRRLEKVLSTDELPGEVIVRLCDDGVSQACWPAGLWLMSPTSAARDERRAFGDFIRACEAGEARSCLRAAFFSFNGIGTPADQRKGRELLDQACMLVDHPACVVSAVLKGDKPAENDCSTSPPDEVIWSCREGSFDRCGIVLLAASAGACGIETASLPSNVRTWACPSGREWACRTAKELSRRRPMK